MTRYYTRVCNFYYGTKSKTLVEKNVSSILNKKLNKNVSTLIITTDKVYQNNEWSYGYRENDKLGGHDPYSASKASAELAISSWRSSFCGELFV